jgi:hypothetical protein
MKRYLWAAVILVLVLALAGWDSGRTVKYRLYIGLNDQDTYQQVKSTEEAQELVAEIALKYVEGFTLITAQGVYTDHLGVVTRENSLICEIIGASEEQINHIMDEVLSALNQSAILVEREEVESRFYAGSALRGAAQ